MGKKWLQWSSTRSLVLWWFRSSCCNICMLRARLTSHSYWWISSQHQKVTEKAHSWTSDKKVNQPGASLLTYLLTSLLTYIMKKNPYIHTQSCKVQVRRNQKTSHVAWLTSNGTCWWWWWWWWSCQVNEVATQPSLSATIPRTLDWWGILFIKVPDLEQRKVCACHFCLHAGADEHCQVNEEVPSPSSTTLLLQ